MNRLQMENKPMLGNHNWDGDIAEAKRKIEKVTISFESSRNTVMRDHGSFSF